MPPNWNHRNFVGPPEKYYILGPRMFLMLVEQVGLQPNNTVLDVGCGSLRVGRLLIPYLNHGCYHGIEPEKNHYYTGLRAELSESMIAEKEPLYSDSKFFDPPSHWVKEFDLVIAIQVFIHCGVGQFRMFLRKMRQRTKTIFVTLKIDPEVGDTEVDWPNPQAPRYPAASHQKTVYSLSTLQEILDELGWKITWHSERIGQATNLILTAK